MALVFFDVLEFTFDSWRIIACLLVNKKKPALLNALCSAWFESIMMMMISVLEYGLFGQKYYLLLNWWLKYMRALKVFFWFLFSQFFSFKKIRSCSLHTTDKLTHTIYWCVDLFGGHFIVINIKIIFMNFAQSNVNCIVLYLVVVKLNEWMKEKKTEGHLDKKNRSSNSEEWY